MGDAGFQFSGLRDPRIAVHAISINPVWLWSADGLRVLWCNAAAGAALGLRDPQQSASFTPADPRARQILQLADRLTQGAVRLERLRGFGKPLGGLLTCACSRIDTETHGDALLIVAMEAMGRIPALSARLQWLVDGIGQPAAGFDHDGLLVASNMEARDIAGDLRTIQDLGETCETGGSAFRTAGTSRIRSDIFAIGSGSERASIALMSLKPAPANPALSLPAQETIAQALPAAPVENADTSGPPHAHDISPGEPSAHEDAAAAIADGESPSTVRRRPLRFVWQMNADGRFALGGDEFSKLLGPQGAASLGRPWDEIARELALDPQDRVARAVATRLSWSGIVVDWPFDNFSLRLPVELSALPLHDRMGNFLGYRGFGVCGDLEGLDRLARRRAQDGLFGEPTAPERAPEHDLAQDNESATGMLAHTPVAAQTAETETEVPPMETPPNVVPFRLSAEMPPPALTPVENNAFDEIARRLSEGLGATKRHQPADQDSPLEPYAETGDADDAARNEPASVMERDFDSASVAPWLSPTAAPPSGTSRNDRQLLDLVPAGILIYRIDHLLYANTALLSRIGFASLNDLQAAGGLETLEIEPQSLAASSTSADGMPLTITARTANGGPAEGRLFAVRWDDEPAHALVLSPEPAEPVAPHVEDHMESGPQSAAMSDLAAILEAATDAIVLFSRSGAVTACNRRAQNLFGYPGEDFMQRNLTDLFAFESQRIVLDYFESIDQPGVTIIHDHGREVVGCTQSGQFLPLSMTMGRSDQDGARFFAVFRDLSQLKQNEAELMNARRKADRAASAKSDALARLSHDIRAPLNTIIGFANMMIEEKIGALGNGRYLDYAKDIRSSAEQVLGIIGDMLDLSEVETGRIKLDFKQQSLNETVEKCVSLAQPQANRERIIIRTSLAHHLPLVSADTHALRQITANLIASSIRLSKAGGQVIVSTALDEARNVILRVRDTGRGLSESEISCTMDPYRSHAPVDPTMPDAGIDLSLTKALAEANNARFHVRRTAQAGTLIEIAFPAA